MGFHHGTVSSQRYLGLLISKAMAVAEASWTKRSDLRVILVLYLPCHQTDISQVPPNSKGCQCSKISASTENRIGFAAWQSRHDNLAAMIETALAWEKAKRLAAGAVPLHQGEGPVGAQP